MKKIIYITYVLIVTVVFFTACSKKDSVVFMPYPGGQLDSAWVANIPATAQVVLLGKNIAGQFSTAEINAGADASIASANGYTIQFPSNALQLNGTVLISGRIKVDYFLIQKKGDFIRYGVSTASNMIPFESGGSVLLKLSLNNQPVQVVAGKKISIRYRDPEAKSNMGVYFGEAPVVINSTFFNWAPALPADSSTVKVWDSTQNTPPGSKGYIIETGRTGWIGVGRPLLPGSQKTEVSIIVPNLFSNANTAVYMAFTNYKTVVQLTGNAALRKFTCPNMPVGKDVKIIIVSKVGDTYYFAQKDEKITNNMSTFVKPEQSSLNAITSFLATF